MKIPQTAKYIFYILSPMLVGVAVAMPIIFYVQDNMTVPTASLIVQEQVSCKVNALVSPIIEQVINPKEAQNEIYNFEVDGDDFVTIPNKINKEQAALLKYAYEVAQADGYKDPSVLQGLIWQESKAGGYPGYKVAGDEYGLKVGKRYYGVGQIKVAAAKDVFRRFPDEFVKYKGMSDDEIIAYLITDDKFNIRVASKYLWMMKHKEKSKKTVFVRPTNYAITAYNRGLGNTYDTDYNNWHYTLSVHKHKDTFIKRFNLANNITK